MAPKCPTCDNDLKNDFGMITCASCGAVVFVDMDGVAHVTDESQAPVSASEPPPLEPMQQLEPMGGDFQPPEDSPSQIDAKDPLGISAYANSEVSSAKDGPLVVSVTISGIDTKDLREEVRQALQDSRFGWDAAQVLVGIQGGEVVLRAISPVKATILINRIKNLPVRIRWEQNAITEIDVETLKPESDLTTDS